MTWWYPAMPRVPENAAARPWNGSVISTVAGVPCCSIWTASCKLHAVHAAQSPNPVMTRWALAAITLASSGSIGLEADAFENTSTVEIG